MTGQAGRGPGCGPKAGVEQGRRKGVHKSLGRGQVGPRRASSGTSWRSPSAQKALCLQPCRDTFLNFPAALSRRAAHGGQDW